MAWRIRVPVVFLFLLASLGAAQTPELSKNVQQFVRVEAPKILLMHVRIIDGTGAPATGDQNVARAPLPLATRMSSLRGERF